MVSREGVNKPTVPKHHFFNETPEQLDFYRKIYAAYSEEVSDMTLEKVLDAVNAGEKILLSLQTALVDDKSALLEHAYTKLGSVRFFTSIMIFNESEKYRNSEIVDYEYLNKLISAEKRLDEMYEELNTYLDKSSAAEASPKYLQ